MDLDLLAFYGCASPGQVFYLWTWFLGICKSEGKFKGNSHNLGQLRGKITQPRMYLLMHTLYFASNFVIRFTHPQPYPDLLTDLELPSPGNQKTCLGLGIRLFGNRLTSTEDDFACRLGRRAESETGSDEAEPLTFGANNTSV